eukprot:53737_1
MRLKMYICNGSCHDEYDTINFVQTSFGQLLLYIKYKYNSQISETIDYNTIKQLWYNEMYKNNPHLFNKINIIINENTFDKILSQIIENDQLIQIILNTFYAFNNSIFIKQLKKFNLLKSKYIPSTQIIISFLIKIIKNINYIFEAKYLFYA